MLSFRVFYESYDKAGEELSDLVDSVKRENVDVFIYYKNKRATLESIRVPRDSVGIGTRFMNSLVNWADDNGVLLMLSAARKGEMRSKDNIYKEPSSNKRLIEFYKKFGFIENRGRNKRFDISDTMYREPKNTIK